MFVVNILASTMDQNKDKRVQENNVFTDPSDNWIMVVLPKKKYDLLISLSNISLKWLRYLVCLTSSFLFWQPEGTYHGTINLGDTVAIGIQRKEAATEEEILVYDGNCNGNGGGGEIRHY